MRYKKVTAALLAGVMLSTLALSGCSNIDSDATVLTMNGETVSLGYANFVAKYQQANYDSFFVSYYGENYWHDEAQADEDGKVMEDTVKDETMKSIETQLLLAQHMADYGVEITEEQKAAMASAAEQFMADNDKDAIDALGATSEYAEQFLYYTTVEHLMRDAIYATADTNISDKECEQRTFSYIEMDITGKTNEDGTFNTYSDEEIAEMTSTFEAVAAIAANDFEAAANAYDYEVHTYSYGADEAENGTMDEAVIKAADKLKEGESSGVIKCDYTYYIIRLDAEIDEEATENKRNSMISERQEAKYTEVTDGYLEEADYTLDEAKWANVKFEDLFTISEGVEE